MKKRQMHTYRSYCVTSYTFNEGCLRLQSFWSCLGIGENTCGAQCGPCRATHELNKTLVELYHEFFTPRGVVCEKSQYSWGCTELLWSVKKPLCS